jgi:hypothetical protein
MKFSLVALVAAVTMFATLTTSPTPAQAECGAACQQKCREKRPNSAEVCIEFWSGGCGPTCQRACKNSADIAHQDPETCMRIYAHRNAVQRLMLKENGSRKKTGNMRSISDYMECRIMTTHRTSIISAAAPNNVPAVYWLSDFARDGGLLSYGADQVDIWRRAATYVDRILRGAKPGDLPVQFPTKFEMVVNLKTAKALGLAVPPSILLRATEVIE